MIALNTLTWPQLNGLNWLQFNPIVWSIDAIDVPEQKVNSINGIAISFSGTIIYADGSNGSFYVDVEAHIDNDWPSELASMIINSTVHAGNVIKQCPKCIDSIFNSLPFIDSFTIIQIDYDHRIISSVKTHFSSIISFLDNTNYVISITYDKGLIIHSMLPDELSQRGLLTINSYIQRLSDMMGQIADVTIS